MTGGDDDYVDDDDDGGNINRSGQGGKEKETKESERAKELMVGSIFRATPRTEVRCGRQQNDKQGIVSHCVKVI